MHATTILMVRKGGRVVIGGDGQVSLGQTIVKGNARKVRRLAKGGVIGGFAGATADAFTLFERLEAKLEQYPGQLTRACVELTKDWRTDRYLRRLEAMMLVADKEVGLLLSGSGDVLEPEGGIMAIGSGGNYALAAARALADRRLDAEAIVRRSLGIAAEICVYTNGNIVIETLEQPDHRPALPLTRPQDPAMTPSPPRNRLRTRPLHRRPERRQARRRHRAAQPLAPPAARGRLREEVAPKNILMIGPTGCGKTEISRRLAKLANAPFLKVEATKFTEVGYVGRDVEQIVRDLVEIGIGLVKEERRRQVQAKAELRRRGARARRAGRRDRERRHARFLPPQAARQRTRRQGDRDRDRSRAVAGMPMFEIPGMPGASMGAINLGDMFGKALGRAARRRAARRCARPTSR